MSPRRLALAGARLDAAVLERGLYEIMDVLAEQHMLASIWEFGPPINHKLYCGDRPIAELPPMGPRWIYFDVEEGRGCD
jgi:hypothetical protein